MLVSRWNVRSLAGVPMVIDPLRRVAYLADVAAVPKSHTPFVVTPPAKGQIGSLVKSTISRTGQEFAQNSGLAREQTQRVIGPSHQRLKRILAENCASRAQIAADPQRTGT